jgi:hypothetical protein
MYAGLYSTDFGDWPSRHDYQCEQMSTQVEQQMPKTHLLLDASSGNFALPPWVGLVSRVLSVR